MSVNNIEYNMDIKLNPNDVIWIKLLKGHSFDLYPFNESWIDTIKPLFIKLYGWNPNEDNNHHDYLNCLFDRLYNLYVKIEYPERINYSTKELFRISHYKSISINNELPIERGIIKLIGLIQGVEILNTDGSKRFNID
jgi:hypothetical protein